jgi:hypothetical protein
VDTILRDVRGERIPTKVEKSFGKNRKGPPSTEAIPLLTEGTMRLGTTKTTTDRPTQFGIHGNRPNHLTVQCSLLLLLLLLLLLTT